MRRLVLLLLLLVMPGSVFAQERGPRLVGTGQVPWPEEIPRPSVLPTVLLQLRVGSDGAVEEASLLTSSGINALDQQALRAARAYRFLPAQRQGVSVAAQLRFRVRFSVPAPVVQRSVPPRRAAPVRERVPSVAPTVTVRGASVERSVSRTVLERRELERAPGTGGDALRALQNLPGLSRQPMLGGALVVRGASPADTVVQLNGGSLAQLYHFGGLTSVLPTETLDRLEFYPGNFSTRYGRALGGVVDVGVRSPTRQGARGVVSLGVLDVSVFGEAAITPWLSVFGAVRRSHVDAFLGAILPAFPTVSATAAPVYWDYQLAMEARPSSRHRVRLLFFGSDDRVSLVVRQPLEVAPMLAGGLRTSLGFYGGQLHWWHELGPGVRGVAMVAATWNRADGALGEDFSADLGYLQVDARYDLSATLTRGLRLFAGIDVQSGGGYFRVRAGRLDPLIGSMTGVDAGRALSSDATNAFVRPALYAEAELTPVSALRIVPGVRVDYFHELRRASVDPRVSARWRVHRMVELRAGVGWFSQPPTFTESSATPNDALPGQRLGNPELAVQRAMHYALGFELRPIDGLTISAEGFYKTLEALVVTTSAFRLLEVPAPPPYTNAGDGRIGGLELLARYRGSERWFGWLAYTLLRSERRDALDGRWYASDGDQTHILTLLASVRLGAGWEVGARFRLVTGSPVTPVVGAFFDADATHYTPIFGPRNSARNAMFHQLDVRVDKEFRWSWGSLSLFLEVLNAYNQANQEGVQYSADYRSSAPVTGLPILPNLGVRATFGR